MFGSRAEKLKALQGRNEMLERRVAELEAQVARAIIAKDAAFQLKASIAAEDSIVYLDEPQTLEHGPYEITIKARLHGRGSPDPE